MFNKIIIEIFFLFKRKLFFCGKNERKVQFYKSNMDKESYRQEIWDSIDKTATYLHYLDYFRDEKEVIEPFYRGTLGAVAVISAIISFFDVLVLIKVASLLTAIIAAFPFFFPILPKAADFEKMSKLRISLFERLVKLEVFWNDGLTEENRKEYLLMKLEYAEIETQLSEILGKINRRLLLKAHKDTIRYLKKFFISSQE